MKGGAWQQNPEEDAGGEIGVGLITDHLKRGRIGQVGDSALASQVQEDP